ncbi:thiamine-binding protein [Halalkalibacter akibai]|uniref:Thiamine-binding protein domain-containing protein n=1 Tax=Halalkalibacter akibai (strain ATCC 43226 / DSM 21942 / CIP 109018 / JCM 9157 / 1139) TaxID=1236973 RepID=W4QXV6_HALA3|nr:thiamine-binding protein [Halalkalibacter akibai]GAE36945.1 hypothetical protein JCM9157_4181 [Halalkalibacter akibai JCM 9157]
MSTTVTAGFQILPNGRDMNTDGMISEIIKVVEESGLNFKVGPMETVVEGNLHDVFTLIQKAQQVGINSGATECMTNIKVHYKPSGISIVEKLN